MAFPRDYTLENGKWILTPRPRVGVDCKKLIKRKTILDRMKEWAK